jgi:hypothetical protein
VEKFLYTVSHSNGERKRKAFTAKVHGVKPVIDEFVTVNLNVVFFEFGNPLFFYMLLRSKTGTERDEYILSNFFWGNFG